MIYLTPQYLSTLYSHKNLNIMTDLCKDYLFQK